MRSAFLQAKHPGSTPRLCSGSGALQFALRMSKQSPKKPCEINSVSNALATCPMPRFLRTMCKRTGMKNWPQYCSCGRTVVRAQDCKSGLLGSISIKVLSVKPKHRETAHLHNGYRAYLTHKGTVLREVLLERTMESQRMIICDK